LSLASSEAFSFGLRRGHQLSSQRHKRASQIFWTIEALDVANAARNAVERENAHGGVRQRRAVDRNLTAKATTDLALVLAAGERRLHHQ
jgi:hypothetical protein